MDHDHALDTPETIGLLAIFGAFGAEKLLYPADFDAFRAVVSRANEAGDTAGIEAEILLNDSILACAGRAYTAAVEAGVPAASFSRLGKRPAPAATAANTTTDGGRPAQRQRAINSGAS
jgi:hypothetical protein